MSRRFRLAPSFALAACLLLNAATCSASSDVKSHFDLPAESLDKALRDFAVQANCNISYEPTLVAGLQAPAVKGDYLPAEVLSLLLSGTKLAAVNVDEHTVEVRQATGRDDTAQSHDKRDLEEITVTGTHIRGTPDASPVIEIGREEIDRSGYTSIADLMLTVPQNFGGGTNPGSFTGASQINARYGDNLTGASSPNLRGLGSGSTLTLIDGHRMASGLPAGGTDIASIPIDAIERVDVVTDSASSIYGSDAVGGVVNIILKQDYAGAQTSASYGYAAHGGGAQKRASQLLGTTWSDGGAMIGFEHAQQDAVDASDRDFTETEEAPNSLLPQTKSNSLTFAARQSLFDNVSTFLDGLYISKTASIYNSYSSGYAAPFVSPSTLEQFAVTGGFSLPLPYSWNLNVFATDARDATDQAAIILTTPHTFLYAEKLSGTMRNLEMNADGAVGNIGTGPIKLALGGGYRREDFADAYNVDGTDFFSNGGGKRHVEYAFTELSLPLVEHSARPGLHSADVVLSARSERYSDFGHETVPKLGLVYEPFESLKMRTTWGRAFKAPNLFDIGQIESLYLLNLENPASPTGNSNALVRVGGNPGLRPEIATAWNIGADYSPEQVRSLAVTVNAFQIKYTNRITQIGNPYQAFTDPANSFYVTPSPSAAFAQSVYGEYPANQVFDITNAPYSASTIAAIVDDRLLNVAKQTTRGSDFNVAYSLDAMPDLWSFYLNVAYLDVTQQDTPTAGEQTLSGLAFYPPRFRFRGSATWKRSAWALSGTVNYLSHESNTQVIPSANVASWTTFDASLRYAPDLKGWLSGVRANLSVINMLNRDPPFLVTQMMGLNYDTSNTTPLGRLVTLQATKAW